MNPSDWIAIVALVVSGVTFLWSHRFTEQNSDRPVLVFSLAAGRRWRVDNVGNGPALNVIVADRSKTGASEKIVNCAPLAVGGQLAVPWLTGKHELVAIYTDVLGRSYTTVCGFNRNKFVRKNLYAEMNADRDQWLEDPIYAGRHEARVSEADLVDLSPLQLLLLRNSIYAKYGYIFPTEDFAHFFSRQPGYVPRERKLDAIEAKFTIGETADAHTILGVYYRHPERTRGPFTELMNQGCTLEVPHLLTAEGQDRTEA